MCVVSSRLVSSRLVSSRLVSSRLAPDKIQNWVREMQEALDTDFYPPALAMKMAGRLQWTASLCSDKVERAWIKAIHCQIHSPTPGFRVSQWLRRSSQWWIEYLRTSPVVWRKLGDQERHHVISWSDGAGRTKRVGCVVRLACGAWEWTAWTLPQTLIEAFLERRDNYIAMVELVSLIITFATWQQQLKGQLWSHYLDSVVAMGAVNNGSTNPMTARDANNLVGRLWMALAKAGTGFFLNRVESKANPADEPSRDQEKLVGELGANFRASVVPDWLWTIWDPVPLDMSFVPDPLFDGSESFLTTLE
jgi:hypothetical protein